MKTMVLSYVFVDESGDLGVHGSKYFIIVAVKTNNPICLSRIVKKLRQRKLKKKIRELPEIKANNSNKIVREYILKKVSKTDCEIFAIIVEKSKIFSKLYEVKNKLYNYFCGMLLNKLDYQNYKIKITIDKKDTNSLMREDFNRYIQNKINLKDSNLKIEILHKHSLSSNELQIVDFIAWSIHRKFSSNDESYYNIIKNKIKNEESMLVWK